MRKNKKQLLVVSSLCVTASILTSCSPKVFSEATMTLPAQSVETVQLFEPGDSVPDEAIGIGTVAVRDMGFATRCKYDNVVHMAKQRTAETGGNGLLITEHKTPNFWGSSCHQVAGTMLYISENGEISDSLRRAATMKANNQRALEKPLLERKYTSPKNVIGVNAGVSFVGSRIETPWGDVKNQAGFTFSAYYDHLWRNGLGIGAAVDYFTTSIEGFNLSTLFVGPEFAYGLRFADHWRFDFAYGLGYGYYNDAGKVGHSGFGMLGRIGIDYMFSEKLGLGLLLNSKSITMKKPEGFELQDDEYYGFGSIGILLGLQFYL